jgi:hypothetical protein
MSISEKKHKIQNDKVFLYRYILKEFDARCFTKKLNTQFTININRK